jgi:hypothetical protein
LFFWSLFGGRKPYIFVSKEPMNNFRQPLLEF